MLVRPWFSMLMALLCIFFPAITNAAFVPPYTIINYVYEYHVNPDSSFKRIHERLIRIDTPQGIDQSGQAKVYYDNKRDRLEIVEAYTLRPNGEKVPVTPERIKHQSDQSDDLAPYFSDQMVAVIIFPQVEVGSQLYYKAIIDKREPTIKDRFSTSIAFTPHRAYESATIRITYPSSMLMQVFGRGIEGAKTILPHGQNQYEYHYKQPEAYPLEPGQVEYSDFSPSVQFSNYDGYADLARVTQDLFQPKTVPTVKVKEVALEITKGAQTNRQKAEMLYNWVSANVRYVGIDVGASGFEPHSADEILEHGYGDCKDHAVILEALLASVDIPSSPVLINTAENYVLPQLAGNYFFDHVITYIPEFDIYLDSTAQFSEFGTLPANDIGKPTLITFTGKVGATPNSNPDNDYTVTQTKLRLMTDGSVVGSSIYVPHGYYVTMSRANQFSNQNRDTQTVIDAILSRYQETGTGNLSYPNPADLGNKWSVTGEFKLDPVINISDPSAFQLPTGLAPGYIKAAASIKPYVGRRYPFSCGSNKNVEIVELRLPESVRITRIPKGLSIKTKDQSYLSSYVLRGHTLYAKREMVTNVKADVCSPAVDRSKDLRFMTEKIKSDLRSQIFIE